MSRSEQSIEQVSTGLYTALGSYHATGEGSTVMLAYFYCPDAEKIQEHLDTFFGPFLSRLMKVTSGFLDEDSLEPTFAQLISPLAAKKIELIKQYSQGGLSSRARVPSNFAWYTACHLNYA